MYSTELNINGKLIPVQYLKDDLFYTPAKLRNIYPIFKAVGEGLFLAIATRGEFQTSGQYEELDAYIKAFGDIEKTGRKIFVKEHELYVSSSSDCPDVDMFKLFLSLKPTGNSEILELEMKEEGSFVHECMVAGYVLTFPTGLCVKPYACRKIAHEKFIYSLLIVYQTDAGNIHPSFYIKKSAPRTYIQNIRRDLCFNTNLNNQACDTYTVADTHFFHKSIITFGKARKDFKTLDEMHIAYIDLWNSTVKPCDNIIVVGDFSFKGIEVTAELLCKLNGRIIFIEGNHDRKMLQNLGMPHYSYLELKKGSLKICISHFPIMCWNGQAQGSVHLHGHTHGHLRPVGKMFDVGIDNTNNILNINDAIAVADSRETICPDGRNL